jgi:hypothetical protein
MVNQEERLQAMVKAEGVTENTNVLRLRRERCSKCLKQMPCVIIKRAKEAKPGQLIAGLFLARASVDGVWQAVLDCRNFVHIPGKLYRARKEKDDGFVGDLFLKEN